MDTPVQLSQASENTYHVIRASLVQAQRTLTSAVNSAMVTAIGKSEERFTQPAGKMTGRNMAKSYYTICLIV